VTEEAYYLQGILLRVLADTPSKTLSAHIPLRDKGYISHV